MFTHRGPSGAIGKDVTKTVQFNENEIDQPSRSMYLDTIPNTPSKFATTDWSKCKRNIAVGKDVQSTILSLLEYFTML